MNTDKAEIDRRKESYPPLEALIAGIDQLIDALPHPYATGGFEAFLGSQLGSIKQRGKQYLCFELKNTRFALPMQYALEITYRTDITPLPNLPQWMLGISNVRGEITSVVDLARVIGIPGHGATLGDHLILLHSADMTIGILADRIAGSVFDEDPHHQLTRRAPEDDALSSLISTVFEDGAHEIYVLDVPRLAATLVIH